MPKHWFAGKGRFKSATTCAMRFAMKFHTRNQKGVAAVEFGILLVPLVILAFGITEFGRAMYQYNTLAKGTRDAARYLSMKSSDDKAAKSAAQCLVLYGKTACGGDPLISGFTDTTKVIIKNSALQEIPGGGLANLVTVEVVGFQFKTLVSFVVSDIAFGSIGTTMFGPLTS